MIDAEVDVFDQVARAVYEAYPEAYVAGQTVVAPPQFPAVFLYEASNTTSASRDTSSAEEDAADLVYRLEVGSSSDDSKRECRDVLALVDGVMRRMNFTRTMAAPVDNSADPSVYRMVAQWVGMADEEHYYRR